MRARLLSAAQAYSQMLATTKLEGALQKLAMAVPGSPEAWYNLATVQATVGQVALGSAVPSQSPPAQSARAQAQPGAKDLRHVCRRREAALPDCASCPSSSSWSGPISMVSAPRFLNAAPDSTNARMLLDRRCGCSALRRLTDNRFGLGRPGRAGRGGLAPVAGP